MPYTCADFDALCARDAAAALSECCSSRTWTERLVQGRPYLSRAALLRASDAVTAALTRDDLAEALAGHPRIGERSDHASSKREQASVASADAHIRDALVAGNRKYEERFGHVYLVRAAGRSADELLSILQRRLTHDSETEWRETRATLAEINRSRLELLVTDDSVESGKEGVR
ncbi:MULTISPECIES: 2-oxo-4-hydroxy-4-carboxy-5-ureidoimidazoline decarboxylase [unclassified Rhodococcus (in: high G+C Gram-positive bacteria)]|uniref:2-oxo-4-hydroxy-4-carboxy-5-ureidoimidazoline decarboxylase n=1 Tax=unclassified Rhodococcus (in: high G+C Gram-positive bacteria) TaxID=192944 RepID=UPI00146EB384|nr:2-oxo-4-hydroxy-4-carboxy-5-ureidoimidazoline decarboxylase [Rhodococcus sp. (in: high G+C Gram-positive bacteria)]MBF0661675.1 2-oxo-4-hydroxy-4-carboxy-5-ureidoimidazoline decarboxylase [Rhodococcus sp. (in: high G+C Gram-positive bacteria)]NMD95734.1 2-oxo-4-hydroxy-4-carboxy-5-ureidoimidazoline decarboxylase [Rhodococcus sp. BL-253-APC-6A1W]NME80536.1 2-oxo-4-hydroxy-4-carboxy-5-ureidoimidazoline decarboxylase [Rhodococcus sp. 105337]